MKTDFLVVYRNANGNLVIRTLSSVTLGKERRVGKLKIDFAQGDNKVLLNNPTRVPQRYLVFYAKDGTPGKYDFTEVTYVMACSAQDCSAYEWFKKIPYGQMKSIIVAANEIMLQTKQKMPSKKETSTKTKAVKKDNKSSDYIKGIVAALSVIEELTTIQEDQHKQSYVVGILTARDKVRALLNN